MKKMLVILALLGIIMLMLGCSSLTIKEVKNENYLGKKVTISGKVDNTMKIGKISGYTLTDKEGESIPVKSTALPSEGSEISVKGTVIKDSLFGYYLQAEE